MRKIKKSHKIYIGVAASKELDDQVPPEHHQHVLRLCRRASDLGTAEAEDLHYLRRSVAELGDPAHRAEVSGNVYLIQDRYGNDWAEEVELLVMEQPVWKKWVVLAVRNELSTYISDETLELAFRRYIPLSNQKLPHVVTSYVVTPSQKEVH